MVGIMRKGGKRARKLIRAVKRARYVVSFQQRYKMTRPEWTAQKKEWRSNGERYKIMEKRQSAIR